MPRPPRCRRICDVPRVDKFCPNGGKDVEPILLTLLYLGIKNIRLGPTLPAFVSPNVLNYLVENFGIAPITTPEEDLKQLLK